MTGRYSLTKKLFKDASWLFGGKAFTGVCISIQTVLLARVLGVTDYGLLVLVISFVDILNNFFDWRVWETAVKYIGTFWTAGENDKTRAMIKLSYLVNITTGLVAFVIAVSLAGLAVTYLIKTPGTEHLVWIYSASLLIGTSNTTSDAILRVFGRFNLIAYVASANTLLRLVLIAAVLYMGKGIEWVLLCYVAAAFFGICARMYLVTSVVVEKGLGSWWRSGFVHIKEYWHEIAWFLANTSLAGTLKMGNDHFLAPLLLGFFVGKEAAALYRVARSVTKVMTRIIDPVLEAIYPELVRISSSGAMRDFLTLVRHSTVGMSFVLIPVAVVITVFPEEILRLIFGGDYAPAAFTLRVLAIAVLINQLGFWINPVLLALGRPGLRTYVTLVATAVYVLLLLILIPEDSYLGAAYAFLGYVVVHLVVSLTSLKEALSKRKKSLDAEGGTGQPDR